LILSVDERGVDQLLIDSSLVVNFIFDNCEIASVEVSNDTFDCSDADTNQELLVTAIDMSGNSATCNVSLTIEPISLAPSFTTGICDGDSLKLFSNIDIPEGAQFQFLWSGPNNYFSTLPNPIITPSDPSDQGLYTLQFEGLNNCQAEATVEVALEQFPIPTITSENQIVCSAESILLNVTEFSGQVFYEWFESDTLIATSTSPRLSVTPEDGESFFTVRVIGQECDSRFSEIFEVFEYNQVNNKISISKLKCK